MRSPRLVPCALLATALVPAAELQLSWSGGVLGETVELTLADGDAGEFFLMMPSLSAGPTRLSIIDPTDPRVLSVGLDLINAWTTGVLTATGAGSVIYGLPSAPALVGQTFNCQALTFPGLQNLVDDISEPIQFSLGLAGSTTEAVGEMSHARRFTSMAPLENGKVLVAGGQSPSTPTEVYDTWELFDPQTQSFRDGAGSLPEERAHAPAVKTSDGRVWIIGGVDATGSGMTSGLVYEEQTDTFTSIAPMSVGRVLHGAVALADGRILVVGGSHAFEIEHPIGYPESFSAGSATATLEIYEPGVNAWNSTIVPPSLPVPLTAPSCMLLGDERVLIAGGVEVPSAGGVVVTTDAAYLYDPVTNVLSRTESMPAAAFHMAPRPTGTGNGMVVGGCDVDFSTFTTTVLDTTNIYDRTSETWGPGPDLPEGTRCGILICIPGPDGTFRYPMLGGLKSLDLVTGSGVANTTVWELDSAISSWTTLSTLTKERMGADAVPFDDERRLLVVGSADLGPVPDLTADVIVLGP